MPVLVTETVVYMVYLFVCFLTHARIVMEGSKNHSLPAALYKVEISLRSPIPLSYAKNQSIVAHRAETTVF